MGQLDLSNEPTVATLCPFFGSRHSCIWRSRTCASLEDNSVLLALGRQFDAMAAKLDNATEQALDVDWALLEEFGRIVNQIVVTPASTIESLCVKARVGCWGLLGDLDDPGEKAKADERITLSIMRDLIRLRHPDLERPGALTRLVREIEEPAVRSSAREAN